MTGEGVSCDTVWVWSHTSSVLPTFCPLGTFKNPFKTLCVGVICLSCGGLY